MVVGLLVLLLLNYNIQSEHTYIQYNIILYRPECMLEAGSVCTCRSEEDLDNMCHGDQMQDVQVVVGRTDSRWLQINSLLLVQ